MTVVSSFIPRGLLLSNDRKKDLRHVAFSMLFGKIANGIA